VQLKVSLKKKKKKPLIFNNNSVYFSPTDYLSRDVACVVTPLLCVFVDKITCFKKGSCQLTISDFRKGALFDAFPPDSTTVEISATNLIGC
jgi:hypothetical protein